MQDNSEVAKHDRQAPDSPFTRILVPIDGSDASIRAGRIAIHMAAIHRLPLTAIYIVDNRAVDEVVATSDETEEAVRRSLEQKGWYYLAHVAGIAKAQGVSCSRVVRRGIPHAQIADVARELGADLIVIGEAQLESARRGLSGTLTARVIQYAHCSVLAVKVE
ncbi:MAG: universal stress protein [Anaerolineae bacterium]